MVPTAAEIPAGKPLIIKARIDKKEETEKGRTKKKLFKRPVKKFFEFNDEFSKNKKKLLSICISRDALKMFFPSKIAI